MLTICLAAPEGEEDPPFDPDADSRARRVGRNGSGNIIDKNQSTVAPDNLRRCEQTERPEPFSVPEGTIIKGDLEVPIKSRDGKTNTDELGIDNLLLRQGKKKALGHVPF